MSRDYLFGDAKATAKAGDAQRKQRELAQAKSAHQNDPSPQTQAALAHALFDVGRYDEAELLLTDLLNSKGDDIQLVCDLGFIYKNLGKNEKAIEMFKRVVSIDAKHALARCAENEIWMIDPTYRPSWLRADE
jgi:Flp pilus assembly protein TadD